MLMLCIKFAISCNVFKDNGFNYCVHVLRNEILLFKNVHMYGNNGNFLNINSIEIVKDGSDSVGLR